MPIAPRERLIVALDLSSVEAAEAMVARLGDAVSFYKIGYQLAFAGGLAYAQKLAGAGKRTFLDLKLHDIGNTVAQGVKSVARLGATFLTVHAYPQTMQAAVEAREGGLHFVVRVHAVRDRVQPRRYFRASNETLVQERPQLRQVLGHQTGRGRRRGGTAGVARPLRLAADLREHPLEAGLHEGPGPHVLRLPSRPRRRAPLRGPAAAP